MGCSFDAGFQRPFGGVAPDRFGSLGSSELSLVRTRTTRARGAQDWPIEAVVRVAPLDGENLFGLQIHDRSIPAGRSRARPDAAEPSIAVRGVPPTAAVTTGGGLV